MIKIGHLSDLLTQENNLIRERQGERNKIDRDISAKRSEVLSLQQAEREIKGAVESMRSQIVIAESILTSLLNNIKNESSSSQNETVKMQEYYEHLQKKVEQATEYFANAREIQMTVQDMEKKRDLLYEEVEKLKTVIQEWREAWNTKENSIKARENAVKNAEIGIQYDRDQLETSKYRNDEKEIELRKREKEVSRREQEVQRREKLIHNP